MKALMRSSSREKNREERGGLRRTSGGGIGKIRFVTEGNLYAGWPSVFDNNV
jgi:hypothetical protein